ncbi:MAG: hypothetical protein RLZZ522_1859 [Verrucomicrobiota bacterium]
MISFVAIKPQHPIHLEIQRRNTTPVGILRTSFRDPVSGCIRHTDHGRVTGLPLETLLIFQAALRGEVILKSDPEALRTTDSREYGASAALLALAKDIGLDKVLYSLPHESWVQDCLAMIVGRIVHQGSKLALSQCTAYSALWSLCGSDGPIDVNEHCYKPMDRLLERQPAIQKNLAAKHLTNGTLVLYDITSSYFEGEYADSEIVQFGYNRDGKRGHEQVVIGLITTDAGCPICVEVFPGNTQDASTVAAKVSDLSTLYGIKNLVFVGDRGMITASNEEKLKALSAGEAIQIISALTHREIVQMLERTGNQPELFDEHQIVEVTDPDAPARRYCLCRNPLTAQRETTTRRELLERTQQELARIAAAALKSATTKTPASSESIGARVGKILEKTRMGRYVTWRVLPGCILEWHLDDGQIAADTALDGCYVIKATVSATVMDKEQVVARYKSLSQVEQAFRNLKTVSLEMRPMYHKTDERIRAHVFLCMLAYSLQWHMQERLAPLLDEQRRQLQEKTLAPAGRRWTLQNIIETLKARRSETVSLAGVSFAHITDPTADQARLLELLASPPKADSSPLPAP